MNKQILGTMIKLRRLQCNLSEEQAQELTGLDNAKYAAVEYGNGWDVENYLVAINKLGGTIGIEWGQLPAQSKVTKKKPR